MDLQSRKQKLIEWILQVQDASILKQLESISEGDRDWWDDLSEPEKDSIQRGLDQADKGQLKSHEEVMKRYKVSSLTPQPSGEDTLLFPPFNRNG